MTCSAIRQVDCIFCRADWAFPLNFDDDDDDDDDDEKEEEKAFLWHFCLRWSWEKVKIAKTGANENKLMKEPAKYGICKRGLRDYQYDADIHLM